MDIRGVFPHRLRQQGVDQPDDRCIVVAFEQIGLFGQVQGQMREVRGALEALDRLHRLVAGLVSAAQQLIKGLGRDGRELERHPQVPAHLGDGGRRNRGPVQAFSRAVGGHLHQQAEAAGKGKRQARVGLHCRVQGVPPPAGGGLGVAGVAVAGALVVGAAASGAAVAGAGRTSGGRFGSAPESLSS